MRAFAITWGERTWTDLDISSMHVIAVAELLGVDGFDVLPWSGPSQLSAWIAVLLAADRVPGLAEVTVEALQALTSECLREVYAAPMEALLTAIAPRLTVPPQGAPVDVAA